MYNTYILRSPSKKELYIGHSNDLKDRIKRHRQQRSFATKFAADWELIYSEEFPSRLLAQKREKFFKSGDGRKVLKLKGIIE